MGRKKLYLNETIFDPNTLTEAGSYWCGVIASRGNIYYSPGSQPIIQIQLSKNAKPKLSNFRALLKSEKKITEVKGRNAEQFSVTSQKLASDLSKLGILPRKLKQSRFREVFSNDTFWSGYNGEEQLIF